MADASHNPRAAAALAVAAVLAGTSLDDALPQASAGLAAADRALAQAIAYGVLRNRRLLEWLAARLLERPLKNEPRLQALLLGGLHQLRAMGVPDHAAVAETVAAAAALGKPWAKGLLNAVLRRYLRERSTLEAALPPDPALRLSYPDWLVARVREDWPSNWEAVLAAGNEPGPLTLRVNRRQTTREAYRDELAAAGIAAEPLAHAPDALRLHEPQPVASLPGWSAGRVSVQDAAAQLAAELLDAHPGHRVLDACSAPGGKTAHLLERTEALQLLALDRDAARLARVAENLHRLKLQAALRVADAAQPASWWDGVPFDRILLDAPCSGTGVIRRHPDIKWLRREADLAQAARTQGRLLKALWPLLAPGGVLLYATCSILRAEGEAVARAFRASQADAEELRIETPWGEAREIGRRLAPGGAYDGFYYARFIKKP
ncbi:MAG: 16S rRNA (cytosine(967)-C(5))-methyltransferase RsmB [Sinobacteraceae bacterium]|nr:16S rRNA (cytosine(967)-C(5))-methyltransferase RsmB [Nevskiaceae bacterium]